MDEESGRANLSGRVKRLEFYQRNLLGETYASCTSQRCLIGIRTILVPKAEKGTGQKRMAFSRRGVWPVSFHCDRTVDACVRIIGRGSQSTAKSEQNLIWKGRYPAHPVSVGFASDPANWQNQSQNDRASTVPLALASTLEIDFKVKIHLACGETVRLHTVTDPFSALTSVRISIYRFNTLGTTPRCQALRACFTQWGTFW
jgi:hypothetical protein